jgi:hypothetical protein
MALPEDVKLPSTNPKLLIDNPINVSNSSTNIRILKELSNLYKNPHPNIKVYPA